MPLSEERKAYNQQYKTEYATRTKRVAITLTEAEYREVEKRAKAEGVKVTTLIKNMAFAYHQGQAIMSEPIKEELQELRFLLRNIANNVNQMAHYANTIRKLKDENGFLLEIKKMEDIIVDFVEKRLQKKP